MLKGHGKLWEKKQKSNIKSFRSAGPRIGDSRGKVAMLNQVVRVHLTEKVRFEQRCEESRRVRQVDVWGKSIPSKRNS